MQNNWKSQSGPSRVEDRFPVVFEGSYYSDLFFTSVVFKGSGRYKFIRLIQIISFLAQAIVHGSIVAKIATYNHESKIIM